MVSIPPYLKPGDSIGIVFPSYYMPEEQVTVCMKTFRKWGFRVKPGKTVGRQFNCFAGTDAERLEDFQRMLDDDGIDAVFCGRGGYGMGRIIDGLDFSKFKRYPKWIIGFSDITVLHSHLFTNYKIASLHAPMAAAFNEGEHNNRYVQSIRDALLGQKADYQVEGSPLNQQGEATGAIVGGNLSLLSNLIGTASDINTNDKILFLEGIDEYKFHLDRMMRQMKRSGKLDHLRGLIIGRFAEVKDTPIPFGQTVEEIIKELVEEYDYPICFGFPVSHYKDNYALKVSLPYRLRVQRDAVSLREI